MVVDAQGNVTMVASSHDDDKETALSHTPRTPPLSTALGAFTDVPHEANGLTGGVGGPDDLDLSLMKKKKKKTKVEENAEEEIDTAPPTIEEGGLDLTMKKKKKKKKTDEEGDFAKKLEALQLGEKEGDNAREEGEQAGDMESGTGIWEHFETEPISYDPLLWRFYELLEKKHPDHAASGSRSYKIPPPQCLREGNKKTIFANIAEICKRMKRTDEHVTAYLFAELGTTGSVDGSRRLVIKGRFQAKQIENVLRKYISRFPMP